MAMKVAKEKMTVAVKVSAIDVLVKLIDVIYKKTRDGKHGRGLDSDVDELKAFVFEENNFGLSDDKLEAARNRIDKATNRKQAVREHIVQPKSFRTVGTNNYYGYPMKRLMTTATDMCVLSTLNASNVKFDKHRDHFTVTFLVNVVKKPEQGKEPRIAMFCPSALYQTSDYFLPPIAKAIHALSQVMEKGHLRGVHNGIKCFSESGEDEFLKACKFEVDVPTTEGEQTLAVAPKISQFVRKTASKSKPMKKRKVDDMAAAGATATDTAHVATMAGISPVSEDQNMFAYMQMMENARRAQQMQVPTGAYMGGCGLPDPFSVGHMRPSLAHSGLPGVGALMSGLITPSAAAAAAAALPVVEDSAGTSAPALLMFPTRDGKQKTKKKKSLK